MKPFFDTLPNKYPDAVFVSIDIDRFRSHREVEDVSGVPTFKFYLNGKVIAKFSGADESKLISTIEQNYRKNWKTTSGSAVGSITSQSTPFVSDSFLSKILFSSTYVDYPPASGPSISDLTSAQILVQCRFKAGPPQKFLFPSTATLHDLFVKCQQHLGNTHIEILQPLPRKVFNDATEGAQSLVSLHLNNASVMVRPL